MAYKKIDLNGLWQIEPGGIKPKTWNYEVNVPALVDASEPTIEWEKYEYFWYRKQFQLPVNSQFEKIYLHLEQIKYGTQIWLNENLIGGDIPCYTSQTFDLTPFINKSGTNILLIRVGTKKTLPEHSAVGNDFEKSSFIPGIWGDVWLHLYGKGLLLWNRIIPDIKNKNIKIHSEIENISANNWSYTIEYQVSEKKSGKNIGTSVKNVIFINSESMGAVDISIDIPNANLWSPEDPFLYVLNIVLLARKNVSHEQSINFGMREFMIKNGNFYLNGQRRVLMGSNIAFHRMFSDSTRGELPWNKAWIKKALVDIPKENNMFFFRFHLGHAYNKWYDVADEYGIMLQDEWMFWTTTGTYEQIEKEFTAWIKENINHPSIVIWDALNECEDKKIIGELIPKLKKIDPTRPWEMADFCEDHPYIYSLGPVLNREKFGYSRSLFDLTNSPSPTMVNEYIWWWINREGNPTPLTEIVYKRWLGNEPTKEQLLEFQSFLTTELTELWRRSNIDAIMPFVYLSIGIGATANWFNGSLEKLEPKPVLKAVQNVFSPVGISIELWDRHFLLGDKRKIPIYLFNDTLQKEKIILQLYFDNNRESIIYSNEYVLEIGEHKKIDLNIEFPSEPGDNNLIAEILTKEGDFIAKSSKVIYVFNPITKPDNRQIPRLAIHDPSGELNIYLNQNGIEHQEIDKNSVDTQVIFFNGSLNENQFSERRNYLEEFVKNGGTLILQEPEFGEKAERIFKLFDDLEVVLQYRIDPERGGYDSYVHPENSHHFLWDKIPPEHLRMFNGSYGGEIISQHNVRPNTPFNSVALCNIKLIVPALMEIPYGKGWIILSRIQIRGRMLKENRSDELFERRYDPVAEQYFLNLVTKYINCNSYQKQIKEKLSKTKIFISHIKASSGQIYDLLDGKMSARWTGKMEGPQWVWIDFSRSTILRKITIHWENACGKTFRILSSNDNQNWKLRFTENDSDGEKDEIDLNNFSSRYLKIDFEKRDTQWSCSIWEIEFE